MTVLGVLLLLVVACRISPLVGLGIALIAIAVLPTKISVVVIAIMMIGLVWFMSWFAIGIIKSLKN